MRENPEKQFCGGVSTGGLRTKLVTHWTSTPRLVENTVEKNRQRQYHVNFARQKSDSIFLLL